MKYKSEAKQQRAELERLREKSATSKNAAISNTMRAKVDLARKDADEGRVQLGAIRMKLREVNKKLLTAEKKVANLTNDLQASNRFEAAIASLFKDVNNLQEERVVPRAIFHMLKEEKKTKEKDLKVEVKKYKSEARQQRAEVERLRGRTALKMAYAYSRAKSATSKNAAISNTMRAKVDLARKDADEALVELGAIRMELGEVNKKLLTVEKKVANLTKDLQSSNQLEAAIASLSKDVNNLQEERDVLRATALKMAYIYSRAKSATSKNAAISNTMRARVDLANKDANEARVQLGPIQMELGEVNKKLLTAEKKVAKLTKDLQASNQFEAAIASQSKDVNNLQEEREVLRAVFHRLEEEKKTKEEELKVKVMKYKSEAKQQRAELERLRGKAATSKIAAISNTMRAKVDLARKDADEGRVQLGAIRMELGEVNKKLLTAEKKVAKLTKDLQSSNQFEAAIASLSKDVNNLQEEREVLWAVFHMLEEEKKIKEEELKVQVKKYKSEARQQRAEVERLRGKIGLMMAYAYSRAKSATCKNTAISNTMQAKVDLARKDADEARVQLGAILMELGEVNKKLLTAEKKVANLTKDLHFEAAIASLSKDVNNLQEEREVLWTVFHRLEVEKKTKEEELKVEVEKYKSEARQQRAEVERLGGKVNALEIAGLDIFYDLSHFNINVRGGWVQYVVPTTMAP
ncbi:uncharacterized protein LOC115717871 [Cannabis sativa]|uniref:uncharacterized protein LOC115717871 n=1 Tax=Cannabis sativa TaxID=3483 RepID=UPI0029C9DE37|nr:uncharacterized protein LOC115717871 [Cannabis sativa]